MTDANSPEQAKPFKPHVEWCIGSKAVLPAAELVIGEQATNSDPATQQVVYIKPEYDEFRV